MTTVIIYKQWKENNQYDWKGLLINQFSDSKAIVEDWIEVSADKAWSIIRDSNAVHRHTDKDRMVYVIQ